MISQNKLRLIRDNLETTKEFLAARGNKPDLEITSIPSLNRKIWGITRKKLTLIAARPSNFKTALALQFAYDISEHHKVLYLSLEQSIDEAMERLFCNVKRIDNVDLLRGGFDRYRGEWESFCEIIKNRRLIITEGIGYTWPEVENVIDNLKEGQYPDMIILDYINCVSNRGVDKRTVVDEFVKKFRAMAIKKNFAAVICNQINRSNVEGSRLPTLAGMKDSGFLEEHADKALLLHWDYHTNENADINNFKIIIAKNKSGRTGSMDIKVFPESYRFEDKVAPSAQIPPEARKVAELVGGTITNEWEE